jgi:hypothetical protein
MAHELREPGRSDEFEAPPLAANLDGTWSEQLILLVKGGPHWPPAYGPALAINR